MSHRTIAIIVIALLVLVAIIAFLVRYFRVLDTEYEEAVEIPEVAVETLPYEFVNTKVNDIPDDFFDGTPDISEPLDNTSIRQMTLRLNCPRLFRDDWCDITLREFSQWAVELRREYGIAA